MNPLEDISLHHDDGTKKTQSSLLIEIGDQQFLFHDEQRVPYALIRGKECYALESASFKDHLQREHYRLTGKGANRNAVGDAVSTLCAKARFDSEMRPVYLRVAFHNANLYIDLCDDRWRVVEIDDEGWRVLDNSPVMFARPSTAKPLPEPRPGGSLDWLRKYVNVRDDRWPLVYGFILCCFAPSGPYPHLALIGEQGTGKSQGSRILRSMVDPSSVPLKQPPKDEEHLVVAALNNRVVALDNMSGLRPEISDALCRLSTGGGMSKRKLYTDAEEFTVDIQRPAILNGIDDLATRPDLSERTITLELEPIEHVRLERDIWEEVDAIGPGFFGAVCDALSAGLTYRETTVLDDPPRMADAATWVQSCEMAEGLKVGSFIDAFELNQWESVLISLEANAVSSAVMRMMKSCVEWTGSPGELLDALSDLVDEETRKSKAWPKSPDWLIKTLRRFGKPLRRYGIDFKSGRTSGSRFVTLVCRANSEKSRHWRHWRHSGLENDANDANDAKNRTLHVSPAIENLQEDWE